MKVERVVIVDFKNVESGEYKFKSGGNIIVSTGNSQGKSSLVKTLYYALGMQINRFPKNWNISDMAVKVDIYNERTKENIYVVRIKDLFYVSGNKSPLNLTEYTKWLSEQLGVDLKLTLKLNKMTTSISYPSVLIAPFYIDQDESWSGRLYSSANEIKMYMDTPQRIMDYILNISDDEDQKFREKLSQLQGDLSAAKTKYDNVDEVYRDYLNDLPVSEANDVTNIEDVQRQNKASVEKFIVLIDAANRKYLDYKSKRINLQRDLDQKLKSLSEFVSVLKLSEDDYKYIKTVCKHCNSELTREQVTTRLNISSNIIELTSTIANLEKDIHAIRNKISETKNDEDIAHEEYEALNLQSQNVSVIDSLSKYVEIASRKKSQEEFATVLRALDNDMHTLDATIKDIKKEQRESNKSTLILAQEIKGMYSQYITNLSLMMAGSNISSVEWRDFKAPKSSGVDDNQTYLGVYLTYIRLISEYGRFQMPFCIDSFIKNETTDPKTEKMFAATEEYLLKNTHQSILTAVKSNVEKYLDSKPGYNKIILGDRLLTSNKYEQQSQEITSIIKI